MSSQEILNVLPKLHSLAKIIGEKPELFALGSQDVRAAALDVTKLMFDLSIRSETYSKSHIVELINSLEPSRAPQTRSQTNGKRKRSSSPLPSPKVIFEMTPLASLFVENMDEDQVWAQLDLKAKSVCQMLDMTLEGEASEDEAEESGTADSSTERLKIALEALENGEDIDFDELQDQLDSEDDDSDEDASLDEEEDENEMALLSDSDDMEESIMKLHDTVFDERSDQEDTSFSSQDGTKSHHRKRKKHGHPELDDGFFDLASFNAETEQLEAQSSSRGQLGGSGDSDDDDDDDDMPVDLFAPVLEKENDDLENSSGELFYRDFFEPPPRKVIPKSKQKPGSESLANTSTRVRFHDEVRVKKIRAKGKNLPLLTLDDDSDDSDDSFGDEDDSKNTRRHDGGVVSTNNFSAFDVGDDDEENEDEDDDDDEEDLMDEDNQGRLAIERFKDDLFAEEENGSHSNMSTHEKRQAALQEQITQIESANVGPKDWVLMGETNSRTRPQNSLLEEDLEFERVMKPVPVITDQRVQVLEELIKARIIEGRYDDVVRIRPWDDKPFLPSRYFELKDTKSALSLAQIYENDFIASQTGNSVGEDRDGKLKKEHSEIEQLWENVCAKLDALCNAHFIPKRPKATITTVPNVSAATLESALPTTKSSSDMLAPEEIFTPMSTTLRARSELTPGEKQALRTKARKAKKKSRDDLERRVDKYAKVNSIGGMKKQKQAALKSVVKSGQGITVVGKANKDLSTKKGHKTRT